MALREGQISPQYIRKTRITVTVLDVLNPTHFVVKESPTLNASSEAKSFLEAEEAMQKYYGSLEPAFFPLPLKDSVIVVFNEKKFYRAKVLTILTQSAGHLFKVYLVDYGVECSVPRECTFEMERDFSKHPFQAVDVKLLGIEPISLVMNTTDLSMTYGPVTSWDPSAEIFISDLHKEMCNAYIEVKAVDEQYIYGSLFICYNDNTVKCVNDELISKAFAQYDNSCWEKVHKIEDVLENNPSEENSKKGESSTFERINPEQMSSSVSTSKVEPELKDLRTMFLRPDGKVVSKSSFPKVDYPDSRPKVQKECVKLQVQEMHQTISPAVSKAVSPDHKAQEMYNTVSPTVSKAVSPDQKVQEIRKTISPVSAAVSPEQKALNLNRIQKLQRLSRKRFSGVQSPPSDTDDKSVSFVENKGLKEAVASDATVSVAESNSNQLNITASEKTTKIISTVDMNGNLDNLISQSNVENNGVCAVLENKPKKESSPKMDAMASKRFQKLQELCRKRKNYKTSSNMECVDSSNTKNSLGPEENFSLKSDVNKSEESFSKINVVNTNKPRLSSEGPAENFSLKSDVNKSEESFSKINIVNTNKPRLSSEGPAENFSLKSDVNKSEENFSKINIVNTNKPRLSSEGPAEKFSLKSDLNKSEESFSKNNIVNTIEPSLTSEDPAENFSLHSDVNKSEESFSNNNIVNTNKPSSSSDCDNSKSTNPESLILKGPAAESHLRQEYITEEDKIIALKKFQKLQMLARRKRTQVSQGSQVSKNTVNKDSTTIMEKIENKVNDLAISADKIDNTPNLLNIVRNEMSQSVSEAANNMSNDCQIVSSSELPVQTQKLDELPERSPKQEKQSPIMSKNLSTFQKLQQKVRNKKIKQSTPSQELTDNLENSEKTSQMNVAVESPADILNLNSPKSPLSTMSEAICSPERKSSLVNHHRGVVDIEKMKALIDENMKLNQKAIQEPNLIEDVIRKTQSNTRDFSSFKQETVPMEIKIVPNNSSTPVQQQNSSLLDRSVKKSPAYSAGEFESPKSVLKSSFEKSMKSSSSNSRRSLECSDIEFSPMEPQQSEILNELLLMSDYDDPLCSISTKSEENVCDRSHIEENYIELSTQLKHSDPKLIDFNELSLWEKQKIPALLIGVGLTHPIFNAEEAKFSKHIFQVLKDINFYGPSCIQSVIWPSIEKNRCMVAVAPPHAGKTVSYVLPLVSTFTEEEVPKSNDNGPSTIILCSSWLKAQAVYDLFYFFLRNKKMSIIALCTDGGHYRNRVVSLINSCDVLIATPYCLLQFLKGNSIKFDELENFILDDTTALMNKHKKELKNILLSYLYGTKRSKNCPQLMLFAERWNKNFHVILDKMMSNPLIFFTSFLESAVFAKISIYVHVCEPEQKKNALLGIIKEAGKVVICTTNLHDAVNIHHFLRCEDVTTFLVTEEMEHYIADEVIKDWKSVKCMTTSHCLVITDQTLINMSISNAACLVHYDIPPESRLQFGNRFSCIAEHFQEINPTCVSHILITESDHYYAPQIVEIVENSGGTPPADLIELCKKQNKVEDTSDLKDLCPYFKAFGFCKERQCKNRHIVDAEKDKPQVVPYEGDIQGLVTHIVDASHYYVRLLKYLDPVSNKTVSLISQYAEIGFLLRDYYNSAPAHLKVESPVIGETYVLAEDNNLFYRIKVLKEVNSPTTLPSWKVLFLDEGWIKQYEKPELYELSDKIKLPDPIAVEVYVCNITTPDSCFDWNPQTSQLVSDLIKGKEIHGKIALCLGNTLWLDPLVLVSHLANTNEYITLFKLNQKLLECGHVRRNKNHLVNLHQACTGKILLPNVAKPSIKKEKKVVEHTAEIHYAFLECNTYEDVYVSSVISPHQLYVQRAKFVECLDNLLDKINEEVQKRTLKKAYSLHKGFHCIAPFHEDDRYYRAVVTDIDSYTEVHLFYVDFGDSAIVSRNNIYCLPAEFLLLPFQAIECELAGIAAAHGGWTDSSVDALKTLTRDEAGDMKILQLKAYTKSSCYDGGNHYMIDLWFNEKNLSEQLLQAGFGIPVEVPTSQPPPIKSQDISSEPSSDEEFNLNEKKISSDEEMDAEDKDSAALFYNYVAEMVLQANNLMPKPGATITEVSSDDEKCSSQSNETNKVACEKIRKDLVQLLPKVNLGKNDEMQLEPVSTSHRPLIKWWDTPEQLNVLINLKEVKIYQLVVTDEGFNFNTIITGIQYSADEKLYDKIHSSDAKKYQNCEGINIVVKKHTPFKWPRLTKEKRKFLHITYDLIHIEDSDTDEQSTKPKKPHIRPEYAANDDNSSSTDEEEKYVEPWKDFAQQISPFSNI